MIDSKVDIYTVIAINIKKYRTLARITQADLAERVGVSHEFIRRIESKKGPKTFSIETIYKISLVLDITMNDLFYDNI